MQIDIQYYAGSVNTGYSVARVHLQRIYMSMYM